MSSPKVTLNPLPGKLRVKKTIEAQEISEDGPGTPGLKPRGLTTKKSTSNFGSADSSNPALKLSGNKNASVLQITSLKLRPKPIGKFKIHNTDKTATSPDTSPLTIKSRASFGDEMYTRINGYLDDLGIVEIEAEELFQELTALNRLKVAKYMSTSNEKKINEPKPFITKATRSESYAPVLDTKVGNSSILARRQSSKTSESESKQYESDDSSNGSGQAKLTLSTPSKSRFAGYDRKNVSLGVGSRGPSLQIGGNRDGQDQDFGNDPCIDVLKIPDDAEEASAPLLKPKKKKN